ncbi:hypothetical protein [Micromonospora sp. CPCC 205561]|uniref:hypothetical protein n=1 Tax=Micromonospora sp. CPCC 205561 TaxID=3122407 RepID=UPI002FF39596
MTLGEFIDGIPAALTPEAQARAVDAAALRNVPNGLSHPTWSVARSQAKAAALSAVDIKTPGPARDAAWAAVAVAMDAAGAYAVQEHLPPDHFAALLVPWEYMVTPPEGEPA